MLRGDTFDRVLRQLIPIVLFFLYVCPSMFLLKSMKCVKNPEQPKAELKAEILTFSMVPSVAASFPVCWFLGLSLAGMGSCVCTGASHTGTKDWAARCKLSSTCAA